MSKLPEKISISESLARSLYVNGLPRDLSKNKPFDLNDVVRPFISDTERMTPKRVSKATQLEFLEKIYDNPFFSNYIFCISGYPNDAQAKTLAALLMHRAFSVYESKTKLPPKWNNLYLGFDNNIIRENYNPAFLVLSNINGDTSQKVDKLKDCLENHCNIPRIVVCSGVDPVTFFDTRVHYQINGCVYLQSKQVKKANEL